jgi:hypothetical protein
MRISAHEVTSKVTRNGNGAQQYGSNRLVQQVTNLLKILYVRILPSGFN